MRGRARIILPLAFALAGVQSLAGAATITVDIAPTATLQPGSKAVVGSVSVTCPSRTPGGGIQENRFEVRQMRRGTLVVGVGGTGNVTCDGKPHTYQITAHVQEQTHRFGTGPAQANMFVLICSATSPTCSQGDVTEDLVIVAGDAGG